MLEVMQQNDSCNPGLNVSHLSGNLHLQEDCEQNRDDEWVACGRKIWTKKNVGEDKNVVLLSEEIEQVKSDLEEQLSIELCDPMKRKRLHLKPSLTPGAGTLRVVRRQKPTNHEFSVEPVSDSEEAFRQWRDAMRTMARLPEGVPAEFRKKVWLILADHQIKSQHINWPRVVRLVFNQSQFTPDDDRMDRQIVKDLHRTGCETVGSDNDRAALKRVLLAYARWNKRVGYCQGFNILGAVILDVMQRDEESAFKAFRRLCQLCLLGNGAVLMGNYETGAEGPLRELKRTIRFLVFNINLCLKIMVYLIDYILPESYFADNLQALSVDVAVFLDLLRLRQPLLAAHLQHLQHNAAIEAATSLGFPNVSSSKKNYEPPLTNPYAIQWFLTLFSTCFPTNTVHRLWDSVLLEGSEIGLRTGLVILDILSDDMIKLTSADTFYSNMSRWMEEFLDGGRVTTEELIHRVYTLAPLPWLRLKDLREQCTLQDRTKTIGISKSSIYGDGYDAAQKARWWNRGIRKVKPTDESLYEDKESQEKESSEVAQETQKVTDYSLTVDKKNFVPTNADTNMSSATRTFLPHLPLGFTRSSIHPRGLAYLEDDIIKGPGGGTSNSLTNLSSTTKLPLNQNAPSTWVAFQNQEEMEVNETKVGRFQWWLGAASSEKETVLETQKAVDDEDWASLRSPSSHSEILMGVGSVSRIHGCLHDYYQIDSQLKLMHNREQVEIANCHTHQVAFRGSIIKSSPASIISSPMQVEKQRLADLRQIQLEPEHGSNFHLISVQPVTFQSQDKHQMSREEDTGTTVSDGWPLRPLSTANSHSTGPSSPRAKSLDKSRLKLYQFDESVLQTINEWQRRNAAFSSTQSESDFMGNTSLSLEQLSTSSLGDGQKTSSIHSPRTLLSLSRMHETVENEIPDSPVHRSASNSVSDILNKSIIRDRNKPTETYNFSKYNHFGSQEGYVQSRTISQTSSIYQEAVEDENPLHSSSPPPPWAAAFASISASRVSASKGGSSSTRVVSTHSQMGLPPARKGFGERFGLYQQPDSFLSN